MKIFIPLILGLSLFSCGSKEKQDEQIKQMINDGAFVVDVRTPREFSQGAVEGAVNIPISSLDARIKELENKNGIVVYCKAGVRAAQAKAKLERAGIPNVINGKNMSKINNALKK